MAALVKQGVGVNDIAIHQGVHHSTISRYLSRLSRENQALKQFNEQRGDALATMHAKALNVQDLILDDIEKNVTDPSILKKLSAHAKVGYLNAANIVGAVAYDKRRLEMGKSTANLAILDKVLERVHTHLFERDTQQSVDTEPTDAAEPQSEEGV